MGARPEFPRRSRWRCRVPCRRDGGEENVAERILFLLGLRTRPGLEHALVTRVFRLFFVLVQDLEGERRGAHRAATALDDRQGGEEIADHALAHLEVDLLGVDLAGALEVTDAVAVHDDPLQRQLVGGDVGTARTAEDGERDREQKRGSVHGSPDVTRRVVIRQVAPDPRISIRERPGNRMLGA
jgi:hypothetical protein